jgi:ferredoxin--NADP+ reductase
MSIQRTRVPADADRSTRYNATVTGLRRVHEDLMILRVRPDAGIPAHVGGQHTVLGLGAWEPLAEGCQDRTLAPIASDRVIKRVYSLSTSLVGPDGRILGPEDEDYLEFYVALVHEDDPRIPSLTGRLFALGIGRRLWVDRRILGDYTLEGVGPRAPVLFLATGTGEAPHNAMVLDLVRRGHRGPIASVVCVRRRRDLGYLTEHRLLEARWPHYRYIPLTTREPGRPRERIQDVLRGEELVGRVGFPLDPAVTHVFVCGNPKMVGAPRRGRGGGLAYDVQGGVIEMLIGRGFSPDLRGRRGNLHFEAWWSERATTGGGAGQG